MVQVQAGDWLEMLVRLDADRDRLTGFGPLVPCAGSGEECVLDGPAKLIVGAVAVFGELLAGGDGFLQESVRPLRVAGVSEPKRRSRRPDRQDRQPRGNGYSPAALVRQGRAVDLQARVALPGKVEIDGQVQQCPHDSGRLVGAALWSGGTATVDDLTLHRGGLPVELVPTRALRSVPFLVITVRAHVSAMCRDRSQWTSSMDLAGRGAFWGR
jgi:hypothetical protein